MLKQTLYCSGNVTDSLNIWAGLIGADSVRLGNDSRSEKNGLFFKSIFFTSIFDYWNNKSPGVLHREWKEFVGYFENNFNLRSLSWDAAAVKRLQVLTEKRMKKVRSDSAVLHRTLAVGHCCALWGHRSTRNGPRWRSTYFQDVRPRRRSPFWSGAFGCSSAGPHPRRGNLQPSIFSFSRRPNWSSSAAVNNCEY